MDERIPKRFQTKKFLKKYPEILKLVSEPYDLWFTEEGCFDDYDLFKPKSVFERVGSAVSIYTGDADYMYVGGKWISVEPDYAFRSNYSYADANSFEREGETLLECIDRCIDEENISIDEIKYIVTVNYGLKIINHRSEGKGITIYQLDDNDREKIKNTLNKLESDSF
jgi:hypothetical protein